MLSLRYSAVMLFLLLQIFLAIALIVFHLNLNLGNDLYIYLDLTNNPLAALQGSSEHTQYPVMLGLLLLPSLLFKNLGASPELSLQVYFSVLGLAVCVLIDKVTTTIMKAKKVIVTITVVPWIFLVSSVFVQEDIIGALIMLLAMIAMMRNAPLLSLLFLSFGIIVAKLFFAVFLLPFLLFVIYRQKRFILPLLSSLPGLLILSFSTVNNQKMNNNGFWSFETPLGLSINAWSLAPEKMLLPSMISITRLSLIAVAISLAIFMYKLKYLTLTEEQVNLLWLTIGCSLLVFLYQIQPEYLFLILPALPITSLSCKKFLAIMSLFPISVLQNVLYGFSQRDQGFNSKAKSKLLNSIVDQIPILGFTFPYQFLAFIFTLFSVTALVIAMAAAKLFDPSNQRISNV